MRWTTTSRSRSARSTSRSCAGRGCLHDYRSRTVVTGRIERGVIKAAETVDIIGIRDTKQTTTVTGVEMFRKLLDEGQAGENVGLLLRGTKRAGRRARHGRDQAGYNDSAHRLRGQGLHPPRKRAAVTRRSSTTTVRSSTSVRLT